MITLLKRPRYPSRRRVALLDELIAIGCGVFVVAYLGFVLVVCAAVWR